jgi:hypothetical protein
MTSDQPAYTSNKQFDPSHRLDGLFLVCSDGRFEEQVNDFREHLRRILGLRKLDRYFIPGSQLQFVSTEAGYPPADKATDYWARFFIDNHHLSHVVIVGHELCAAYQSAPAYQGFGPDRLRQQQETHLLRRRDLILRDYPNIRVHLYYMKPCDGNSGVDFFTVR